MIECGPPLAKDEDLASAPGDRLRAVPPLGTPSSPAAEDEAAA